MSRSVIRWTFYLAAALVIGPLAGELVAMVEAADGGPHATAMVAGSIGAGWLATLAAWGLAGAAGLAAARLLGLKVGLSVAGLVLVWAAARSGSVEEIVRISGAAAAGSSGGGGGAGRGVLIARAVEGAIIGVLTTALFAAMVLVARPDGAHETMDGDDEIHGVSALVAHVRTLGFVISVLVAAAVGGVVVWVLAREGLKLQTIGAVTVAAILMGAAGRVADHRSPSVFIGAAIVILAVVGPLVAVFTHGAELVDAAYTGMLHPLARPAPLDWAAGAMLGSRWGLDWSASLMEKRVAAPATK